MEKVVGKRTLSHRGRDTVDVFGAYRRLGPPLTLQAEPHSLRRGVLTLRVHGAAWLTELSFMLPQLKHRLNQSVGREVVQDVRLQAGAPPPPRKRPLPRLSPEDLEKVERWGAQIRDPEVRAAVLRAAARDMARKRS